MSNNSNNDNDTKDILFYKSHHPLLFLFKETLPRLQSLSNELAHLPMIFLAV